MSNWACRKCKVKLESPKIYVVETPRFLDVQLCAKCATELRKKLNDWLKPRTKNTKKDPAKIAAKKIVDEYGETLTMLGDE